MIDLRSSSRLKGSDLSEQSEVSENHVNYSSMKKFASILKYYYKIMNKINNEHVVSKMYNKQKLVIILT